MTDITSDQPRCRILLAARKLFHRKGFFATSISDVAEEAGVLKGHLSYYFPSKSNLLSGTTSIIETELADQLHTWADSSGDYQQVIGKALQAYEESATELATWGCVIGTLNNELAKDNAPLQQEPKHLLEMIQQWLQAQFSRQFPAETASKLAEQLLCMLQGAALIAHAYRDPAVINRQVSGMRQWLAGLDKAAEPIR